MTASKDWHPKGRYELSKVGNRSFELWALETIESESTAVWEVIGKLWQNLPLAWPSTRERILRRMSAVIAERNDPTSAVLGRLIEGVRSLSPPPASAKALPHDIALFRMAAEYAAGHSGAPNREIARSVGVNESVVRQWKQEFGPEFELAGRSPALSGSQIFLPILGGRSSLAGEGKFTVNEHVIGTADRKKF
jgi:hypothetical protein